MIKRVNFTGRHRIARSHVDIEVFDGKPRTFEAKCDLSACDLPADAWVVLEATCSGSSTVRRFEFGEVGSLKPPENRSLQGLDGANVFFTLKVVDRSERIGRILAIAEQVRPARAGNSTAAGRQGILPIDLADLGQELWRLELSGSAATLLVNRDVPRLKEMARSDPFFYAVVYPQVVRQLLSQAIASGAEEDEPDDRWERSWLQFGRSLHPTRMKPPGNQESDESQEEWVDEVVGAFCSSHELKSKFLAAVVAREGVDA